MRTTQQLFFILALLLLVPLTSTAEQTQKKLIPFTATTMSGQHIDLETIIGKKPVMLVFWASWCPVCKEEVPRVNQLMATFAPRGIQFIGINVDHNDSPEKAKAFMKKTGINYPVIYDKKAPITRQYRVLGVPTIIVADTQGTIIYRDFVAPEPKDLEKAFTR